MTIKNIFNIHPLFYFAAFVCFITGHFKEFIIFSSIIIVHEFGHIFGALICRWNIEKVTLLPFGGITIFKEHIDKCLNEELLIALLGPIFQIIFYLIYNDNYIFSYYNKVIFLFNMLPICPLDGAKILNIFLNKCISFKYSHIITIIISVLTTIFIIFLSMFRNNLLFVLIIFFLALEVLKELRKHNYYFNKFLLERYLYPVNFRKQKIVNNVVKMKKQTKHIFHIGDKYITEKEFIKKRFDN